MSVATLMRSDCPHLLRALLSGPVRRARNDFLRAVLAQVRPMHVLEVGGGRGGDARHWVTHTGLHITDVVEPSGPAVSEYKERLVRSFAGVTTPAGVRLPDGREFRFHACGFLQLPPTVAQHRCDLVVLYFSLSQIVTDDDDIDALLGGLFLQRAVCHVVVGVHDHFTDAALPQGHGITCTIETSSGCSQHPLLCPQRKGRTARLHTTILGSTTASGIVEHAFSVDHFLHRVRCFQGRHPEVGSIHARVWRPWGPGDAHWLLRSMVFLWLHRYVTDPDDTVQKR